MNEKENLEATNSTAEDKAENLDYSFDFSNQVAEETPAPVLETAEPKMVDVSVPVMDETPEVEIPEPQMVDVSVPVMETPEEAPVMEAPAVEIPEPQMVDVSVPVVETPQTDAPAMVDVSVPVVETPVAVATEPATELKDGKSTMRFGIILGLIVGIFIVSLPIILKYIG